MYVHLRHLAIGQSRWIRIDRGRLVDWTTSAFNPLGNTCRTAYAATCVIGARRRHTSYKFEYWLGTENWWLWLKSICCTHVRWGRQPSMFPCWHVSRYAPVLECFSFNWGRSQYWTPLLALHLQTNAELNARCEWSCYLQSASLVNRILPPCGGPLLYTLVLTLFRCAGNNQTSPPGVNGQASEE